MSSLSVFRMWCRNDTPAAVADFHATGADLPAAFADILAAGAGRQNNKQPTSKQTKQQPINNQKQASKQTKNYETRS